MKKVFGQTIRDIKREINKKVLKVHGIEQKILDATSNEPWGPHGTHLADIALATRNSHKYQIVMSVIWKRINDTGKNWRHVFKCWNYCCLLCQLLVHTIELQALTVLEYLVAHVSERVIDEIREHSNQISTLSDFQYVDPGGRDQGSNVRRKSQTLVALVNNKERIQEVRQKAHANKQKYGGAYRPSSGGYGDRSDDERYGNRDDDRNGRERDKDKYGQGRGSYSQGGDGRDNYRDEYRGHEGDDYHYRSRSKSVDIYTDHSFNDDDRHSTQYALLPIILRKMISVFISYSSLSNMFSSPMKMTNPIVDITNIEGVSNKRRQVEKQHTKNKVSKHQCEPSIEVKDYRQPN